MHLHTSHTHTHSLLTLHGFLHTDRCMYTHKYYTHTPACSEAHSSSSFPASSTTSVATLPTLPVLPCLPHRGDFTQSEIQCCQHMSLAINLCHWAISLGSLCLIHYQRGLHADRLGSVVIMFSRRISLKRSICFALCDFMLYCFMSALTNDNKQPASALVVCTESRITEEACV